MLLARVGLVCCPEGTIGLSLGFQPQVPIKKRPAPKVAVEALAFGVGFPRTAIFPVRSICVRLCGRYLTHRWIKNLAPLQSASWAWADSGVETPSSVLLSLRDKNHCLNLSGGTPPYRTKLLSGFSKPHRNARRTGAVSSAPGGTDQIRVTALLRHSTRRPIRGRGRRRVRARSGAARRDSLLRQIAQRGLKQILDWEKALGQSSNRTLKR
jgi:hypothetical protein